MLNKLFLILNQMAVIDSAYENVTALSNNVNGSVGTGLSDAVIARDPYKSIQIQNDVTGYRDLCILEATTD